jgi:RimJ/RimL family protein N-acetyltransferase
MMYEPVGLDHIEIALDIINSNPGYNRMENGSELRSREEVLEDLAAPGQQGWVFREEGRHVGLFLFLEENPKDGCPWLGLLMVHGKEQGKGYGREAYLQFEDHLKQLGKHSVRIGVIRENTAAKAFWTSLGFSYYDTKPSSIGKEADCYEKKLAD